MPPLIQEVTLRDGLDAAAKAASKDSLLTVYLRGGLGGAESRYSLLAANPMKVLSWSTGDAGNPWEQAEELLRHFSPQDQADIGLPLGGCFGYWGYHLKDLVEPSLKPRIRNLRGDREPDCLLGFYSSLAAFDHHLGKGWIISTGLEADGSRNPDKAAAEIETWKALLSQPAPPAANADHARALDDPGQVRGLECAEFARRVRAAQDYIRQGDIYQVNLSYALKTAPRDGWGLFDALNRHSPAPYSAWIKAPGLEIASSSPEQFLHMSGSHIITRPIKGTRPRGLDPTNDALLAYELQTSAKENAELVMITDLLRNDIGKVCEFGSVHVPDLARLERFSHVQHLVSTVEGTLRSEISHAQALRACFPGGSITGAPKFRAMQIIDELETEPRGCYTGALGYIGFNRESRLSIIIRTAVQWKSTLLFNVGSGIVADSDPEAEYAETVAKAAGFMQALREVDACPNHKAAK